MAMWMAYAVGVAALLAVGGLALERICEARGWPRRFVWLGALILAVVIPLTASPAEQVASSPTEPGAGLSTDAAAGPGIATVGETGRQASLDRTAYARDGHRSGSGRFASIAPLFVWALASLFALTVLASVLLFSIRARSRWQRRLVGGEHVYVSQRFGPALVGITRPAIVIPGWVLRLGEAAGYRVVKHEREHARARDHLVLLCAGLVLVAFPWSPAIWWMCLRLRAAVEIDCDRRVIASGIPAGEYGRLLLGIGAGRQGGGLFALGMANSGSLLERRLRTIGGNRRSMGAPLAILLGALAVGSVTAACDLPAPTGIAPAVEGVLAAGTESDWEQAGRAWEDAGRDLRAAERELERAQRELQRAEREFQKAEREFQAAEPVWEAPDRASTILERATEQDGRVRIRGINPLPAITLSADEAARNPRAEVDGRVVEGGLRELLTMMDTLNFVSGGYSSFRPRVWINTPRRGNGR